MTEVHLNHHSTQYIIWYKDTSGELHFLFDRKDSNFFPDADIGDGIKGMQRGVNALGGNYIFGANRHLSPEETGLAELGEEFGILIEPEERLETIIGVSSGSETDNPESLHPQERGNVRAIGEILSTNHIYADTLRVTFPEGSIHPEKPSMTAGVSLFMRELTSGEYHFINEVLQRTRGKVTPDNFKFGSTIEFVPLDSFDGVRVKSAYGHHNILNAVIDLLPTHKRRVSQPQGRIEVARLEDFVDGPLSESNSPSGGPTYAGMINAGVRYVDKSPKN